jgi:hypothetical protein
MAPAVTSGYAPIRQAANVSRAGGVFPFDTRTRLPEGDSMASTKTLIRSAILAGAIALVAPAAAANAATDGTSNTVIFAESITRLDEAHHVAVVKAPQGDGLRVGRHFDTLTVRTPQFKWTFSDILVSSLSGTRESLSLNFTKVEFMDYTDDV